MCLMVIIFDWTLIIISSLLGATLIVNAFNGTEQSRELLFIGSMVTGIVVQGIFKDYCLSGTFSQGIPQRS